MTNSTFVRELIEGVGGRASARLRKKTAIATARDLMTVGKKIVETADDLGKYAAIAAMGLLLRMAGELMLSSATLLSEGEYYSGAALLRQVTEIEYLTWAIKEKHRAAEDWLQSTHKERMAVFAPVELRRTSKGRFLDSDYRGHCEFGGHPTPQGAVLLGERAKGFGQMWLADLLTHSWRIWDQIVAWSKDQPKVRRGVLIWHHRIGGRLNDWAKRDPLYKAMCKERPEMREPQQESAGEHR